MTRRPAPGLLVIDLRPFVRAIAQVVNAFTRLVRGFTEAGQLEQRRGRHGGMATDAARWPELWQSAVCTAWLHEQCPSDAHDLRCTCKCHKTVTPTEETP